MATNDITGDDIRSKANSDKFRAGWDAIFGKKEEKVELETSSEETSTMETSTKEADSKEEIDGKF